MSWFIPTMRRSDERRRRARLPADFFVSVERIAEPEVPILSSDLRLFALTFLGGFLFMTVYLA